MLLLAGEGVLKDEAKQKASDYGIADAIKFIGFRTDVNELMQAMDVYIMPSLYEGFPVTGVEAQVSGLPCVFSDTITKEVSLSDNLKYISLDAENTEWADMVLELAKTSNRGLSAQLLKEKGFDIKDMAKALERIYSKDN